MTTRTTISASDAGAAAARSRSPADRYRAVRGRTEDLCRGLAVEDMVVQSMPDASPARWHLAHTTWFFETFVLARARPDRRPHHPLFNYLFNSYYLAAGDRHCRPKRGLITRPTVEEVLGYREQVDSEMIALLERRDERPEGIDAVIELGLNHEEQHQELILTDLKHLFAQNPLRPTYRERDDPPAGGEPPAGRWVPFPAAIVEIGHRGDGFAFDNESPRHRVLLERFELASRPVTCGEYRAFIDDGGYRRGELWLSEGWSAVQAEGWEAPLYWERDGRWRTFTLSGMRDVDDREPVCHVSYFEADAYARWAGARLPTEAEWESAGAPAPVAGNFLDDGLFHPAPARDRGGDGLLQVFGDVWEWTGSAYLAYPGYRPLPGALGEYNGKFMCNQFVLRGGSCATPRAHIRATYRNFFPPTARWQFTGIRLARNP